MDNDDDAANLLFEWGMAKEEESRQKVLHAAGEGGGRNRGSTALCWPHAQARILAQACVALHKQALSTAACGTCRRQRMLARMLAHARTHACTHARTHPLPPQPNNIHTLCAADASAPLGKVELAGGLPPYRYLFKRRFMHLHLQWHH